MLAIILVGVMFAAAGLAGCNRTEDSKQMSYIYSGSKEDECFSVKISEGNQEIILLVFVKEENCKTPMTLAKEDFGAGNANGNAFALFKSSGEFVTPEDMPECFPQIDFILNDYKKGKMASFELDVTYLENGIETHYYANAEGVLYVETE